ncbi:MAG: ABC transporter ATP-binding protein [Chlamydiota bacterium]
MLTVENLNLFFSISGKKLHAVRGVSFSLVSGEILGIVGESGCGKSSLAKALVKLLPSHSTHISGSVLYLGKNLIEFSEKELQKVRGKEIGMIFQDPMTFLNPTLKIGAQIVEGYLRHTPGATYKHAKEHALAMLDLVGIVNPEKRFEEYPHTLSGGTRQRVMIAQALVACPKILIADEPTTALDVTIQAQILELLKEIQKKTGMSIILITHDLSVIAGFCDRVLVMYAGKIIESAPVVPLFKNPSHPYTKRLLQAIPRLNLNKDHPLIPIEGAPPNLFSAQKGCAFCPRCFNGSPLCAEKEPQLTLIDPEHFSACHHHD